MERSHGVMFWEMLAEGGDWLCGLGVTVHMLPGGRMQKFSIWKVVLPKTYND